MTEEEHFFFFLRKEEARIDKEAEKKVLIEKAINLKLLCDYAVSCSYGDLVLIIAMLHDYIRLLDNAKGDDITYQAYYRKKFQKIADSLASQIDYDYDEALRKCQKNREKQSSSDVGEEAMTLAVKYSGKNKKKQSDTTAGEDEDGQS